LDQDKSQDADWTGTSTFQERLEFQSPNDDATEGRKARGLSVPAEPTPQEKALRDLTRIPFRSWRRHCMRLKQDKPSQVTDRLPVIQVDYCFTHTAEQPEHKATILTAIDIQTGLAMASVVTQKGANRHAVYELRQFLFEVGRTHGIIQTDQEPAVLDLARSVAKELPGLAVRASPKYHSQSLGSAERFHQTLHAQVRTLKIQLETSYVTTLSVTQDIFPWLVRHAAWLISRYLGHSDGLTSYHRRWGRNYETALCEFAETVQFRDPGKQTSKLTSMWETGLWLGKDSLAGETIVATQSGVRLVRSVRRLVPSEKYTKSLLDTAKGTPWSLKGNGDFQQLHFPGMADFVPKGAQEQDQKKDSGSDQKDPQDKAPAADHSDQKVQIDTPMVSSESSLVRAQPEVQTQGSSVQPLQTQDSDMLPIDNQL